MKPLSFTQAQFVCSAFTRNQFPSLMHIQGFPLPEIALVGRSNVGKSSLINHLLKNNTLAKVSSTPGKTQSINFFVIDKECVLVDLPGYGYAKTPKRIKQEWAPLIDTYLNHRPQLKLILLLIDSRRELNQEDAALLEWASFHQKPLILLFTKSDKLTQAEKERRKKLCFTQPFLYYSIKDPTARNALIKILNTRLCTFLAESSMRL